MWRASFLPSCGGKTTSQSTNERHDFRAIGRTSRSASETCVRTTKGDRRSVAYRRLGLPEILVAGRRHHRPDISLRQHAQRHERAPLSGTVTVRKRWPDPGNGEDESV